MHPSRRSEVSANVIRRMRKASLMSVLARRVDRSAPRAGSKRAVASDQPPRLFALSVWWYSRSRCREAATAGHRRCGAGVRGSRLRLRARGDRRTHSSENGTATPCARMLVGFAPSRYVGKSSARVAPHATKDHSAARCACSRPMLTTPRSRPRCVVRTVGSRRWARCSQRCWRARAVANVLLPICGIRSHPVMIAAVAHERLLAANRSSTGAVGVRCSGPLT